MGDFVGPGYGAGSSSSLCGDDLTCKRDVIISNVAKTSDDEIVISLQYKSSQDIIGYQFVLSFDTTVVNPTSASTFTFVETTSAVNFTKVEQLYSTGNFVVIGDFDSSSTLIPASSSAANFLEITINQTGVFSASLSDIDAATSILKTNSNQNSITNPNPIFAFWNTTTSGAVNNSFWSGSSSGSTFPVSGDLGVLREKIKKIYSTQALFDSGEWLKEMDTRLKGWFDVTDLCSIALYLEDSSRTNLLVDYICEEEIASSTDCDDCECPEELNAPEEEEECKSQVFISEITQIAKGTEAIITLSYRSSCCIDGYDVTLGNLKPRADYDSVGGIINTMELQDQEPVQREWLEEIGIDPTFTSSEFLNNASNGELVYPRAFGFSFGSALNAYEASGGKNYGSSKRTGAWCIPSATRDAKILTRLVVNLDSFDGIPTIEKFRLVTNDELVSPCSFDTDGDETPCEITWTGIDLNEEIGSSSHATIKYEDLQACLFYLTRGLGNSETSPLDIYNTYVEKFISELGRTELDIVDVLTVANHIAIKGNNQASDPNALIVPKDCCVCTLPGSFSLVADYVDCSDASNPGTISVEWTQSSGADGYKVYRRSESVRNPRPSDFELSVGLADNGFLSQSDFVFTELELIETNVNYRATGGDPALYDKPKLAVGCCDDKHTVEYIVVAFNKCGEVSRTVTVADYQCCDITPTANNIEIIRPINSTTSGFFPVDYAPSPAPFGTCTDDADDCKGLTFIVRDISVPGGNLDYSGINTGRFSYQPPLNYVGPVVITYEAYTETECSDSGTITIKFAPEKISLDTKSFPCGSEDHGKVFLSWDNPTGNYLSFIVQRKLSTDSTFANVAELDFTDYEGLATVSYVDDSIVIDECCSADLIYDYRVAVVGLIEGVVQTGVNNLDFGSSKTIHTFSFTSRVTIPCCSVNNVTNLSQVPLGCDETVGALTGPVVQISWDDAVNSPDTSHYIIYRKIQGASEFTPITKIVDDGSSTFSYNDLDLKNCFGCGTSYTVDYRVVTVDVNQTTSGDPNSASWATGTPGDPCSEGGSTVQGTISCCDVTPCPDDITIKICSDETKEIQLVTGCLVSGQAVTFGKDPSQSPAPNSNLVTIAADGATTIRASFESIGTHTQDFLVVSCGQIGSATLTIEIVDCGCHCADNEAEYIICDNDTYNAEIESSPGKTVDQVPFIISTKRSQPKRDKEPYVTSQGPVPSEKPETVSSGLCSGNTSMYISGFDGTGLSDVDGGSSSIVFTVSGVGSEACAKKYYNLLTPHSVLSAEYGGTYYNQDIAAVGNPLTFSWNAEYTQLTASWTNASAPTTASDGYQYINLNWGNNLSNDALMVWAVKIDPSTKALQTDDLLGKIGLTGDYHINPPYATPSAGISAYNGFNTWASDGADYFRGPAWNFDSNEAVYDSAARNNTFRAFPKGYANGYCTMTISGVDKYIKGRYADPTGVTPIDASHRLYNEIINGRTQISINYSTDHYVRWLSPTDSGSMKIGYYGADEAPTIRSTTAAQPDADTDVNFYFLANNDSSGLMGENVTHADAMYDIKIVIAMSDRTAGNMTMTVFRSDATLSSPSWTEVDRLYMSGHNIS